MASEPTLPDYLAVFYGGRVPAPDLVAGEESEAPMPYDREVSADEVDNLRRDPDVKAVLAAAKTLPASA